MSAGELAEQLHDELAEQIRLLLPYLISKFIVELPVLLFQSFATLLLVFFCYGLQGDFMLHWFVGFCVLLAGSSIGTFLSCLTAEPSRGLILSPLFLDSFPECFSGVLQPLPEIKPYFRWLSYIAPHSYAAEIAADVEFSWVSRVKLPNYNGPLDTEQQDAIYKAWTEKKYEADPFTMGFEGMWGNWVDTPIPKYYLYILSLLVFWVVLRLYAWFSLTRLSRSLF